MRPLTLFLYHTQTFLWQQQSSADRADKMTVLAIKTSSRIIRMRLKLIWTQRDRGTAAHGQVWKKVTELGKKWRGGLHWQLKGSGSVYIQTKPGRWSSRQTWTRRPPGSPTPWKEAIVVIPHVCSLAPDPTKRPLTATFLFFAMAKLAMAAGKPWAKEHQISPKCCLWHDSQIISTPVTMVTYRTCGTA